MKRWILSFVLVFLFFIIFLIICFTETRTKNEKLESENSKMKIYSITRDSFYSFLEQPTLNAFNNQKSTEYVRTFKKQWYIRRGGSRFTIRKELLNFVTDEEKLKTFLSQQVEVDKIQDIIIFEAPNTPVTVCVKSKEDFWFITINEQPDDEKYIYRGYSFSEYKKKYGFINATLKVEDKYVQCDAKIKMYHEYADVPFVETLVYLGMDVRYEGEEIVIKANNDTYRLNTQETKLMKNGDEDYNMLYQLDGGVSIVYYSNNSLMIDTNSLITILEEMGVIIHINCDRDNELITITKDNL